MIVERIKELTKKNHITVYQLESELNLGHNTIYQWNKRQPSITRVEKIADYFNVSVDYLLGRESQRQPQIELKQDKDVIFTYEGKKLSPADFAIIESILRNNKVDK